MALIDRLTAIGNAIREKNGTTELIPLVDMPQAILDISSGGTETTVEYIESTGTQYIDTGIIPTNHRLKIKFQKNDSLGSSIFGSYGTTALTDSYELTWYQGKWYYSNGQKNTNHPTTPPAVTDVVALDYFTFDNKVIMNGSEVGTTLGSSVSSNSLYLFGKNATYQQLSSMKLWYAQIYDRATEELVRDFVPAVDENGVVCLYDNVTKAYFYNQGEGEFIGGFVENELIEIETLIDESGVLDSTEGTATEKVEQLIDKANELDVFMCITDGNSLFKSAKNFPTKAVVNLPNVTNVYQAFSYWNTEPIPIVEEITVNAPNINVNNNQACMGQMLAYNSGVKKVILNMPDESRYMNSTFSNANNLEEVVLEFSTKNIKDYTSSFANDKKLKRILGILDFSSTTTNVNWMFTSCENLEDVRFAPNTLSISISLSGSGKLTSDSVQSIIDGLATVETAQTLTLNRAIVLTDEQKATINAKGWTLAQ